MDSVAVPRRVRAARVLPFALVTTAAFGMAALPHQRPQDDTMLTLAGVVMLGTCAAIVAVPWYRLPEPSKLVAVAAYCLGVALLRESGGGADAGYFPLLLLPVIWQALYGRLVDLVCTLIVSGLTLILPIILIGGPGYPMGEWRKAAVWIMVTAVVGVVIQELDRTVRRKEATIGAVAGGPGTGRPG